MIWNKVKDFYLKFHGFDRYDENMASDIDFGVALLENFGIKSKRKGVPTKEEINQYIDDAMNEEYQKSENSQPPTSSK